MIKEKMKEKIKELANNKLVKMVVVPLILVLALIGGAFYAKSSRDTPSQTKRARVSKESAMLTKDEKTSAQSTTSREAETATPSQQSDITQSETVQQGQQGASGARPAQGGTTKSSQGQSSQNAQSERTQNNGSSSQNPPSPVNQVQKELIYVTLIIDSGGSRRDYAMEMEKNSTVLQLLQKSSSTYGFSLRYSNNGAYGAFIEEIDGVSNNPSQGMYWLYYCNGKYANVGASSQKLSEGDVILWKYQSAH